MHILPTLFISHGSPMHAIEAGAPGRAWRAMADVLPLRYAREFAEWLHESLQSGDIQALTDWQDRAPAARRAHPSDEHYLPLLVAYGAAGATPHVERFVKCFDGPALAMDAYRFDAA